jgi:hypothetical protein
LWSLINDLHELIPSCAYEFLFKKNATKLEDKTPHGHKETLALKYAE